MGDKQKMILVFSSWSFYVISCLELPKASREFLQTDRFRDGVSAPVVGAAGLGLALLHLASGATIFRLEYMMFPNAKYPIVL